MKDTQSDSKSDISFDIDDTGKLNVRIDTERLTLTSVTEEDAKPYYDHLWSQEEVVKYYASGKPQSLEYVTGRINTWAARYKAQDPFSGLKVQKSDDDSLVGHLVSGHGDGKGESEFAILFTKKAWEQGYGTEAAHSFKDYWIPKVVAGKYKVNRCSEGNSDPSNGDVFTAIIATARPDDPDRRYILENVLKMEKCGEGERNDWGIRYYYRKNVNDIVPPSLVEEVMEVKKVTEHEITR